MKPPSTAPPGLSMPPSSAAANAYSRMPAIMFGSRNTVGATMIPAIAPIAPASPQPSASIQPTRMPTSRLDTGFCAAARIARPSGVKRKNTNSSTSTTSVIAIDPSSCDDTYELPNSGWVGNGLGNGLIVYEKIQPARLFRITSKPMKTITTDKIGASSTGRTITRSISTPSTNAAATVTKNAAQYGMPA